MIDFVPILRSLALFAIWCLQSLCLFGGVQEDEIGEGSGGGPGEYGRRRRSQGRDGDQEFETVHGKSEHYRGERAAEEESVSSSQRESGFVISTPEFLQAKTTAIGVI